MIELALWKFLAADPGVSNLCGGSPAAGTGGPAARIFPERAPQATNAQSVTFPRVTIKRVTTLRVGHTDGRTGLAQALIQLDCWGQGPKGYEDAKRLGNAVRKSTGGDLGKPKSATYAQLDGFRGTMAGVTVQGVFLDDDVDEFDPPAHDDDLGTYRTVIQATIWYDETSF